MKLIKSKRVYDAQIKTRETAISNLTNLYAGDPNPPIRIKNYVKKLQDEMNELRCERDLYY
jgi:hypothetical protein